MKYYDSPKCAHKECNEYAHFVFNTRKEQRVESLRRAERGGWKCTRHSNPDKVLGLENLRRETVLVAQRSAKNPEKLYWNETFGFVSGDGYKAFASDFPEGTKLTITAQIELPEQ
jgi:hypothetical protein